jgi:hypothetical protein
MRCYHCIQSPGAGGTDLGVADAVGVCQQCGEAVCEKHAVKAEFYLPSADRRMPAGSRVLTPLLCVDCHAELSRLRLAPAAA